MATAKKKATVKADKKVVAAKKTALKKTAPAKKAAPAKAPAQIAPEVRTPLPTTVNAYLSFNGNCEEAFNFYRSVFGGKFVNFTRFKDAPPMGDKPLSAEQGNKIMHVSLPISKETILMASDTTGAMGPDVIAGTNFCMSISVGTKKNADKLFNGLSAGGKVTMPMHKTFWGAYFGMFTDKFGIPWMINFDEPKK